MDNSDEKPRKNRDKKKSKQKRSADWSWFIKAVLISIAGSVLLALISNSVLEKLNLVAAFIVLLIFILINITFDVIAIAVTTADIKPFLSMSARKLKAGTVAVSLIRNAEKVNNICADIVGDIAGVVSGSTGAAIIISLFSDPDREFVASLIITSLITGITVGGKALGKSVGIRKSYNIVLSVSKFLSFFKRK